MSDHKELKELAAHISALSKGLELAGEKFTAAKLERAAYWLEKASWRTCGQGYVGCLGGTTCTSDHK